MHKTAMKLASTLLLLGAAFNTWAAPAVGISAATIDTTVGKTFSVDIVMTGFPKTEGGGVTLTFDPGVVQVTGVEVNATTWNFATRDGVIDNNAGRVEDVLFSSYAGVSGDAVVATVTLQAIAKGSSSLSLAESQRNPFATGGQALAVSLGDSVVQVRQVKRWSIFAWLYERFGIWF